MNTELNGLSAVTPLRPVMVDRGWFLLAIGDLLLMLRQEQVRQMELAADLVTGATDEPGQVAQSVANDDPWPVYCFDKDLRLMGEIPPARRLSVFVAVGTQTIGILCDHVWSVASEAECSVEPLPECMKSAGTPISGVARYRGKVAMAIDVDGLGRYLSLLTSDDVRQ